jgi:hypothetical protein
VVNIGGLQAGEVEKTRIGCTPTECSVGSWEFRPAERRIRQTEVFPGESPCDPVTIVWQLNRDRRGRYRGVRTADPARLEFNDGATICSAGATTEDVTLVPVVVR